jgi:hypothetical protein
LDSEEYILPPANRTLFGKIRLLNQEEKENMDENKKPSKHDRKWFLCKNHNLTDLNQYIFIAIEYEDDDSSTDFGKYFVLGHVIDDYLMDILGKFDIEKEAEDYIKEIYDFLVAN